MNTPLAAPLTPEHIARASGSSFLVSFVFLGRARRRALTAVYAFCRVVDDAVDDARDRAEAEEHLAFWRRELEAAYGGTPDTAVGHGVQEAGRRFGVAREDLEEVVQGVAMDCTPPRYETAGELEVYCGRVASAVGRACLPVLGARGADAERYADALGRALQWTNILRDVASDAEAGRVYVPRTWLAGEGVAVEWLRGGVPPEGRCAVDALVRRLAGRAREHFAAADRALAAAGRRHLLPARVMGAVYRDLLGRLERRGADLGGPRVRVPRGRKAWLALGVLLGWAR